MPKLDDIEYVLERQPDGGYLIYVPELPGLATEGSTREEAIAMLRDALPAYLDSMHAQQSRHAAPETLSTEQAANLLGVSRSHLEMLLDRDRIPSQTTAGGDRRIHRSALEDYRERQQLARTAIRASMHSANELADNE
jgi:excisionase family DNA binding protein